MREARLTVVLLIDTDDPAEAREDALAFLAMCREGWYSGVRLDSEIEVREPAEEKPYTRCRRGHIMYPRCPHGHPDCCGTHDLEDMPVCSIQI